MRHSGKVHNGSKLLARSMVFYEQSMVIFAITRGVMCLLLMWVFLDHSFRAGAVDAAKLEPSAITTLRPKASEDDMIMREDIFELQPEERQHGGSTGEMKKKKKSTEESLRQSRKFKESKISEYHEERNEAGSTQKGGRAHEKKSKDGDEDLAVGSSEAVQSRRSKAGGFTKGKPVVEEVSEVEVHSTGSDADLVPSFKKVKHNQQQLEVNEVEVQPIEEEMKERGNNINSIAEDQGKPKNSASSSTSEKESNDADGGQSKLKKLADVATGVLGGDEVSNSDNKQQNRPAKGGKGLSAATSGGGGDDSDRTLLISSGAKSSSSKDEATSTSKNADAGAIPSWSDGSHPLEEEREEDKELIAEYNLGEPIREWDRQRQEWAAEHPEVKRERLFILTGTQPWPCANPDGDHMLLRCFKNKVDYSRIHGVGMFYNTALLDAHMPTFWAKLPVVRATMLAHPEVEWIWWLDADAIITDMEFEIPLQRYAAYNLVVHGWESLVFEKRSWLGLNAGSFLLRNCQWSMDLLERWASMGPKAPMGDAYRHILSDFLPDRPRNPTDDQAALVYLLIKERERWADKLRVELDFFLSGYWLELMDGFEATEQRYRAMEEQHAELVELLQLHVDVGKEKMVRAVGRAREKHLSGTSVHERRPFITHFTGCQPCSGHHNTIYTKEQCQVGLLRALNYADDQVLRTLGYQHRALHLPDVLPHSSHSTN